jgi:Domain of unknown function (DUF4365)
MTITERTPASTPRSVATLSVNGCKARYGVSYLRNICSQAGVGFNETSPDEDVLAVDGQVVFDISSVTVQVKCSSQFTIGGRSATWPVEPEWREKWNRSKTPVYFVLVIVEPEDRFDWLRHTEAGTFHRAAAFWTRVNGLHTTTGVAVPKSQRLTIDTLDLWCAELEASFNPAEEHA